MAKRWDVYAFDKPTSTATHIGVVEGENEPVARNVASKRWPENAKMDLPLYPSGRLILRPEGEVWGMPCKVVR